MALEIHIGETPVVAFCYQEYLCSMVFKVMVEIQIQFVMALCESLGRPFQMNILIFFLILLLWWEMEKTYTFRKKFGWVNPRYGISFQDFIDCLPLIKYLSNLEWSFLLNLWNGIGNLILGGIYLKGSDKNTQPFWQTSIRINLIII